MGFRRFSSWILAVVALVVGASPCPLSAEWLGVTTVDYVIQVSVDGLRSDVLQNLVTAAPSSYPSFRRLELEGAYTYNARSDLTNTETVPNHVSIITGRPVRQPVSQPNMVHHGYTNIAPPSGDTIHAQGNPNVPYKSSVFDVVHDHGLSTAIYASKTKLQILDRSYDASRGMPDLIGADNGRDKIDFAQFVDSTSAGIVDAFVRDMTATARNYTFLHMVEPDSIGHASGWVSPQYDSAVATIDARIGKLFALVDMDPELRGRTAIIVSSDHGGGVSAVGGLFPPGRGHDDPDASVNYTIPLFIWGAGMPPGGDLYGVLANRFDPGETRLSYDAPMQPLWDGDSANIALALMGLEPIPGSTLIPIFQVPEPSCPMLLASGSLLLLIATFRRRRPMLCLRHRTWTTHGPRARCPRSARRSACPGRSGSW